MDTRVITPGVQFDSRAVALVAANTLESLMFRLRRAGRIDGTWGDVPGSEIEMSLVSVEQPPSRFAAWAVQRTFEAASRRQYASMISFMKWHGATVGHIEFRKRGENALIGRSETAAGNLTLETDDSTAVAHQEHHELRLLSGYTGVAMPLYDVLHSILTVMVLSVEQGPDTLCDNIALPPFVLRAEKVNGQRVLTWGYVNKTMRILIGWIFGQERYGELGFLIKRDDKLIGLGQISRQ
ncbi:MAG: hypothetical protein Q9168_006101 [Polycauliona sp. 1 TL-2023]